MDIVFTGQLGQCLFTLQGRKGYFRLERCRVVRRFLRICFSSLLNENLAENTLIPVS